MAKFGKVSRDRLATCDRRLQNIMNEAIKEIDFCIVCGYRGKEDQEKAFAEGKSFARFGQSKHNKKPSLAVDIAPFVNGNISWEHKDFLPVLAVIERIAKEHNIKIILGKNFKGICDYPHIQLG